jgi:hypothetical protein
MRTIRASGSNLLGKLSTWNLDEKEKASTCVCLRSTPRKNSDSATLKPQSGEFYKSRQRRECSGGKRRQQEKFPVRRVHKVSKRPWRERPPLGTRSSYDRFQCNELPRPAIRLTELLLSFPGRAHTGSKVDPSAGQRARAQSARWRVQTCENPFPDMRFVLVRQRGEIQPAIDARPTSQSSLTKGVPARANVSRETTSR